jgi:hypothetical protein
VGDERAAHLPDRRPSGPPGTRASTSTRSSSSTSRFGRQRAWSHSFGQIEAAVRPLFPTPPEAIDAPI